MSLRQAVSTVPKEKLLTYDDYVNLTPLDSGNYELQNGKIIYMPTPTIPHQIAVGNLFSELNFYVKKARLGRVLVAPMDTVFDKHNVLQPDILFIEMEKIEKMGEKKVEVPPDFVVEALSPSTKKKDLSFKKHIYEYYGVQEYWVLDIKKKQITKYLNIEEELIPVKTVGADDILKSEIIHGFEVKVSAVFE